MLQYISIIKNGSRFDNFALADAIYAAEKTTNHLDSESQEHDATTREKATLASHDSEISLLERLQSE
jgi:hypothetical protein